MDAKERLMRPQRAGRAEEGPRDGWVGRPETLRVWLLGGFRVSVGIRTVENHVSNILKKLKVSSRSEVAAWVEAQRS